jgi:hypothetical protein
LITHLIVSFRTARKPEHPRTPDVTRKCSKRAFDGLVSKWRRALHTYDPKGEGEDDTATDDNVDLGERMPALPV